MTIKQDLKKLNKEPQAKAIYIWLTDNPELYERINAERLEMGATWKQLVLLSVSANLSEETKLKILKYLKK